MEIKAIELLKKLRNMHGSRNVFANATNAIYLTPSQQLRNSADAIEAEESFLKEVDEFFRKFCGFILGHIHFFHDSFQS
jgi:hypothetical protein